MTILMKRFGAACLLLGLTSSSAFAATTIAQWTFETSIPATAGSFAAEVGSGFASGFHTGAATAYSSPAGNGSAHSFSANTWAVNDYWQFQVSTLGKTGVVLDWDQTGSATGPKDYQLQYSTNGTTFSNFASYAVLLNGGPAAAWNGTTASTAYHYTFDLSSITALDNQTSAFFRLVDTSATAINLAAVAAAGTNRVDNVTIAATVNAVPEPETYGMLLAGLGLLGFAARRRARNA